MKKYLKPLALILAVCSVAAANAQVKRVLPGDDLRTAIRRAGPADTVSVESGRYTLTTQIEQQHDIVVIGDAADRPVVHFTNFVLGTGAKKLVLENLHIIYDRKYLVYAANEKEVDIDDIVIRNCVIDLGAEGASVILDRSTATVNRIGNILIEDCIVFHAHGASHGLVNIGKESTAQVSGITLRNSTFADFARGAVICSATMDDLTIKVDRCTFYNINTSDNTGAIFHAAQGNIEVTVERSVFDFAAASPKFIDAGSGGIVNIRESYRTKPKVRVRNQYKLQPAGGDAAFVFLAPGNDPTADGVSFAVKDPALTGKAVGDPRWK